MYKSELSKEEFYARALGVIRSGFIQTAEVTNRRVARYALEGVIICLECGGDLGRDYDGSGKSFNHCMECEERD